MKTIGIVADNYKVERFKKKLTEAGFQDLNFSPVTLAGNDKHTAIKVTVQDIDFKRSQDEVKKICQLVELHFKRSN